MAPEGATITLHLIVPQTVGSLEEVYTIIHDQIHTLLSKALQIIEQWPTRIFKPPPTDALVSWPNTRRTGSIVEGRMDFVKEEIE